MRTIMIATLLLASTPATAGDFQASCAQGLMNGTSNGRPQILEEFRGVYLARCECIDRRTTSEEKKNFLFLWELQTMDKAQLKKKETPQFMATLIKHVRMVERIGRICDAEEG